MTLTMKVLGLHMSEELKAILYSVQTTSQTPSNVLAANKPIICKITINVLLDSRIFHSKVILSLRSVFFRHMTFKCMFCFTQGVTNFTLIAFRFKMLGFKMLHGFTIGRPGLVTDQTLSNSVS